MTINLTRMHLCIATFFTVLGVAGCGGTSDFDTTDNTIGGTIIGLWPGAEVKLNNNAGDELLLSDNGNFTFKTAVSMGGAYAVTVEVQPTGGSCTVDNGSGTATAKIADVSVSCEQLSATIGNSEDLPVLNGKLLGLPEGVNVTMSTSVGGLDPIEKEFTGISAQDFDYLTPLTESEIDKNYNLTVATKDPNGTGYWWRCGVVGSSNYSLLTVEKGENTNDLTCMQQILITVSNKLVKIGTNDEQPVEFGGQVDFNSPRPAFGDTQMFSGSSSSGGSFSNTYGSLVKADGTLVIQPQTDSSINCIADTSSIYNSSNSYADITPTGDVDNGWIFSGFDPEKLYKINCN